MASYNHGKLLEIALFFFTQLKLNNFYRELICQISLFTRYGNDTKFKMLRKQ